MHVQLVAQEANAKARLGESGLHTLLESGKEILEHLPYPDRPDNHFKVDPAKWDRQSKLHLQMIAGELDQELRQRFPNEDLVAEFEDALRAL
ncbi:hypothetical protein [Kribbella sp. CA-294648]|uniref:hypothetical protein n=1 Tax=Kribbella sp. CA-294648 TaxID=3239948 RepID=UPI003D8B9A19